MAGAEAEVQRFQEKYLKEAALRRKLHNLVQELRGNIRVPCRGWESAREVGRPAKRSSRAADCDSLRNLAR